MSRIFCSIYGVKYTPLGLVKKARLFRSWRNRARFGQFVLEPTLNFTLILRKDIRLISLDAVTIFKSGKGTCQNEGF
jgi:hypothetical protein